MKIRQLLREQTKAAHERLDTHVAKMNVFETASNYRSYLCGMYGLYVIYAAAIDRASTLAGLAPSVSSLMNAIELDHGNSDGGTDVLSGHVNNLEVASPPDPENQSAIWGVGYVLEGSAMGARYMVKSAETMVTTLGESTTSGAHPSRPGTQYLTKLSGDSIERWPKFIEALNEADCDPEPAIEAAQSVFATASAIFENLSRG